MRLKIYEDNGGRYHWSLVGDDELAVAVSATAFASPEAARRAASAVTAGAGSAAGADA